MTLSKLYSNLPEQFVPVRFNRGLNVVLAEIRIPENRKKGTHNLGKTTLGRLLDFAFLSKRDPKAFPYAQAEKLKDFVFFLEIELADGSFVTIRREVANPTKVSFKTFCLGDQDFTELPQQDWNHWQISFDRAKTLLDGILNWSALKPWPYRRELAYLLRSQEDYRDVFQLTKFGPKLKDWQPFLAHVLGFNGSYVEDYFTKKTELESKEEEEKALRKLLGGSTEDINKIEGIIFLKKADAEKKRRFLDDFDFRYADLDKTRQLVEETDIRIAKLNSERYSLNYNKSKIEKSLKEATLAFDVKAAEMVLAESRAYFTELAKNELSLLVEFNKQIADERRTYLEADLKEISARLETVNRDLKVLGEERAQSLSFLKDTDVFSKYKAASDDLIALREDIAGLESQKIELQKLQKVRNDIRALRDDCNVCQQKIEADIEAQSADPASCFSRIRLFFSEIVEEVINRKALLSVVLSSTGHPEFSAQLLDDYGSGTSADLGHSYRKLLCIAFDMAVLRAHLEDEFPRFVFHDGVFESLDDRKKVSLMTVIRRYADLGIQPVLTMIDSDMPSGVVEPSEFVRPEEVVLQLHDDSEEGRLFRMSAW